MFTLVDLFKMQDTLNKRVGLDSRHFAEVLNPPTNGTMNGVDQNIENARLSQTLIEAGKWLDDLLKAMASEMEELRNCCYWKHWCSEAQAGVMRSKTSRLHFWISFAQALGMTPDMVCGMYSSKLAKNIKRQDDGYSIEVKDKAWALFKEFPDDNPMGFNGCAESLEDLPENVAAHYGDWAKRTIREEESPPCQFPSLRSNNCKSCGNGQCPHRRLVLAASQATNC